MDCCSLQLSRLLLTLIAKPAAALGIIVEFSLWTFSFCPVLVARFSITMLACARDLKI
jgi:hypothetical protein